MPFVFGNDYGGVYNNLLATQQADAQNYFHAAGLQQQQDQMDEAQAARVAQQADANRRFNFEMLNHARDFGLRQAGQDLERQKFDWTKAEPTATDERTREFDFRQAGSLADQGQFGSEEEIAKVLPSVDKKSRRILLTQSLNARKEIDAAVQPLQDAADTLNEAMQLQASGADAGWEDTAKRAMNITADRKLMAQLRQNGRGVWEPVAPARSWANDSDYVTAPVNGVNETARVRGGGMETVSPGEMEAIQGDVPDTHRLAALRFALNPPPNQAGAAPTVNRFAAVTPSQPRAMGGYILGQRYKGGLVYLGGDPNQQTSWRQGQ